MACKCILSYFQLLLKLPLPPFCLFFTSLKISYPDPLTLYLGRHFEQISTLRGQISHVISGVCQGLLSCRRHIGKREDPGDKVDPDRLCCSPFWKSITASHSLAGARCILHSVCILPLVRSLQSAVRSLRFTLTDCRLFTFLYFSVRSRSSAFCYGLPTCMSVKTT